MHHHNSKLHWHSTQLGGDPSRITFELTPFPADAGHSITQLKITHDQFAPGVNMAMATVGWMAILNNLKTLLETGQPLRYAWRG
ncbi:MAG: SRPBCC domain-containing protein [Caldilineaceae bacterium]